MIVYKFLHKNHIVPYAEFICTVMKFTYGGIADSFVKVYAVFVKVFIRRFGACNASVKVANVLRTQNIFEGGIKLFTDAHMPSLLLNAEHEYAARLLNSDA